jgi:hypothetical protein
VRLADVADLPPTLSTEKAAELFGVGVDHLWKLARTGQAPVAPLRLGHALRWPTAAVLRCLGVQPGNGDAEPGNGSASVVPLLNPAKVDGGRPQG